MRADAMLSGASGELPKAIATEVTKLRNTAQSMVALMNDFLGLAQLDSLVYRVKSERVDLVTLVGDVLEDNQALSRDARHQIDVDLPARPLYSGITLG